MNMKCLDLIKEYCDAKMTTGLICRVMFEYQTTFSVFQFYDVDAKVSQIIDFRPFNYYEMWAQKVFINKQLDQVKAKEYKYLPLEGPDGIAKDSDKHVHLFVVGMSRMGVAMGVEAAHLAHYPNYTEDSKIRTKITFIDKNVTEEKDFFMGRFKELFKLSHWRYGMVDDDTLEWKKEMSPKGTEYLGGDFIDIEWEFINGGIEAQPVQDYILASADEKSKVTIAVCLPESNRSHAAALYLSKKIYESAAVQQILVYNRYGGSVIDSITDSGDIHPYCGKLRSFGQVSEGFLDYLKESELVAKEISDEYCSMAVKERYNPDRVKYKGKSNMANNWSNIYNGNTLWTKLRCVGSTGELFNEKDDMAIIESLADVEHNRWNVEELLMNFRPVTEQQQENEMGIGLKNKHRLKGEMTHIDICSNKRLLTVDCDSRPYDIILSQCLPKIYQKLNSNSDSD